MKKWIKYSVLNVGMVIGFVISLFMLPGTTPFWIPALVGVAYACYMNYSLYRKLRVAGTQQVRTHDWSATVIVILLLLLDIMLSHH